MNTVTSLNILRRFERKFYNQSLPNFPNATLEDYELFVAGKYPEKEIFVSIDNYLKISEVKKSLVDVRIAEFYTPHCFIDGELFVAYKTIEQWLQIDKKPYALAINKAKRQLLKESLSRVLRDVSVWFHGMDDGFSEEDIQEMIDEDPDDLWRDEMAEIERFAMLGF